MRPQAQVPVRAGEVMLWRLVTGWEVWLCLLCEESVAFAVEHLGAMPSYKGFHDVQQHALRCSADRVDGCAQCDCSMTKRDRSYAVVRWSV